MCVFLTCDGKVRSEKSCFLDREIIMVDLLALWNINVTNYQVVITLNKKICDLRKY